MVTPLGMLKSARERLTAERHGAMSDIDKLSTDIVQKKESIVGFDSEISALNAAINRLEGVPGPVDVRPKVKK